MIGQTFQPGTDDAYRKTLNNQSSTLSPSAQQALQVLALRLPTVLNGRPMAPADLLKPNMGGVAPSTMPTPTGAPSMPTGAQGGFGNLLRIISAALGSASGPGASVTPGVTEGGGSYRVPEGGGVENPAGGGGMGGGPTSDPTSGLLTPPRPTYGKYLPETQQMERFSG